MILEDKIYSTAPCGLDCFNCPSHQNNFTEETRAALAGFFKKDRSQVFACAGCRGVMGQCMFTGDCPTYRCVESKGVAYCHECEEFPCPKLAPVSNEATNFPHNIKVYNLCRMKQAGVEKWIAEEADQIRKLYFTGKFIPGIGPVE